MTRALRRLLRLAAAVVAFIPTPAAAQEPAGFATAWRDVATLFHRRMDEEGIVGGSLWFLHDGRAVTKEFHGFADLASRRRVDENTIFHWASITKTFTGIALLQLRDRGRLSLDDPLVRYLPELREAHDTFGSIDEITLRELMSHSAGFRDPTWPWGGDKPWHPHEPKHWSQLVAMMPYTEVLFRPGSRYSYSNLGVIFLGRTIELLTDDDFEVYVDKNILKPLGMYDSYFDITPYHLLRHRSNNYTVRDGRVSANGLDFDTGITTSNGGLNAPIPDMVRYLAFLSDHAGTPEGDSVLRRASLEEMWRPVLPILDEPTAADSLVHGWKPSIGLSFFVYERGNEKIVGHTGGQMSFITFIYLDPATGAAAIGAFNTLGSPKPNTRAVLAELRGRLFDRVFPLYRK